MRRLHFFLLFALVLAGCGGSSSSESSNAAKSVKIAWPERSRAVVPGLSSSLSARLTFSLPDGTQPISLLVDRDAAKLSGYTATYPLPTNLSPTLTKLVVTFYAQAAGAGDEVGNATATVRISSGGVTLSTVTLTGKIKTVEVADRTLPVSAPATQLDFTAKDASGAVVAVGEGAASWETTAGKTLIDLSKAGLLTPKAAGAAKVVATVDGVASSPATVQIVNATFDVTFDVLSVPGYSVSALAISGDHIAGRAYENGVFYFNNPVAAPVLIKPSFLLLSPVPAPPGQTNTTGSIVSAIDGNNSVGSVPNYVKEGPNPNFYRGNSWAALWKDGGYVDLNPPGVVTSNANGVSGDLICGDRQSAGVAGVNGTFYPSLATAWRVSGSAYIDIHPSSQFSSVANAVSGNLICGFSLASWSLDPMGVYPDKRAAAWTSPSPFSFVDIHPTGYFTSEAIAVNGQNIVGNAKDPQARTHAILWTSPSPDSAIDLSGDREAKAVAVKGNYVVGVMSPASAEVSGATIWNATNHKSYQLPYLGTDRVSVAPLGMELTSAGIDLICTDYRGRALLVHVPSSLLP